MKKNFKNIMISAALNRNMQWTTGMYLLSLLIFGLTMKNFADAILISQIVLLVTGGYRAYLLFRKQ